MSLCVFMPRPALKLHVSFPSLLFLSLSLSLYIYIYIHTHTHTHTYIYIYIFVCTSVWVNTSLYVRVCALIFVCVWRYSKSIQFCLIQKSVIQWRELNVCIYSLFSMRTFVLFSSAVSLNGRESHFSRFL